MKRLSKYVDDALILAGCALILMGVYKVCPVAVWFVSGLMLIVWGVLIGLGKRGTDDHQ
jgi:hypothetical protein